MPVNKLPPLPPDKIFVPANSDNNGNNGNGNGNKVLYSSTAVLRYSGTCHVLYTCLSVLELK